MFPELTTQRLLLQQILPEDQQFIFEGFSHPDVIPFYAVRYESFEATKTQMDWYDAMLKEGTGIAWKMVLKETGEQAGVICVYYFKPEHKRAEIGYWLLPAYWGKGYALEAMQAVVNYWKKEKGLHRLEAFVEEGNIASSKLLEKCGYQYEGTMKDCEIKDGKFISLRVYGLIL